MSDFGLEIFPEIGGHFAFNGNTTILNYVGSGSWLINPSSTLKENGMYYVDLYHPTPVNSNVILMHNSNAQVIYRTRKNPTTGKTQYYPTGLDYVVDYKRIDNNIIRLYYVYNTIYQHKFDYKVFYYISNISNPVDFGMTVGNNDGFYNIGDSSTPLPLLHSEVFSFNGVYRPPVKDPTKTISFFSWSDPDLTLIPASCVTYSQEPFGTYYGYDRHGKLWNKNTQMKVCTFGESNESSMYGINIYNGMGNKVFNSRHGVLKNIRMAKLQNSEYNYTNLGINSMVCPASVGGRYLQTGRYENGDEIDFGINMYGSQISAGYTRRIYQAASHGAFTAVAPINIFYINHDDYF